MMDEIPHVLKIYLQNLYSNFINSTIHNIIIEPMGDEPKKRIVKAVEDSAIVNADKYSSPLLSPIMTSINEGIKKTDFTKLTYNYSLVSFVTTFEIFFGDLFIILIDDNLQFKNKFLKIPIQKISRKTEWKTLEDYKNSKISVGQVIADSYNFQNLNSIQDAYKTIDLDFYKLLDKEIEFQNKKVNRREVIIDLLDKRHKIVHEGAIFQELNFTVISDYRHTLEDLGIDLIDQWLTAKNLNVG